MNDKPRYRTPYVYPDVEVGLDEFDDEDIVEYLRHNGYQVSGTAVTESAAPEASRTISADDLDYINTLALAGQIEAAQQEALRVVGKAIGRSLQ